MNCLMYKKYIVSWYVTVGKWKKLWGIFFGSINLLPKVWFVNYLSVRFKSVYA